MATDFEHVGRGVRRVRSYEIISLRSGRPCTATVFACCAACAAICSNSFVQGGIVSKEDNREKGIERVSANSCAVCASCARLTAARAATAQECKILAAHTAHPPCLEVS